MSRIPLAVPLLDQLPEVVLVDPEAATIAQLQRIDRWLHALYSEWGGPGFWVPFWMSQSETPDDFEITVPIPPGVELFHLRALVSQRDKTTPRKCDLEIACPAEGTTTTLSWQELSGGNTLEGAFEIATSGIEGGDNGSLRVQSGTNWAWSFADITLTFDVGTGKVWGILFQPQHTPR